MMKNDPQKAFNYCMYKMLAKCFGQTSCKNSLYEKRMYLEYAEAKPSQKTEYKKRCFSLIKQLKSVIPKEFFEDTVEIHMWPASDKEGIEFMVVSNERILRLVVKNQKQKAHLQYRFARCA